MAAKGYVKHKRRIRKPGSRPRGAKWPDGFPTGMSRTSRRSGIKRRLRTWQSLAVGKVSARKPTPKGSTKGKK